jgi:hypothetical protein
MLSLTDPRTRWTFARWETGTGLLRQFAVLSLVVVGLFTAALCLVLSHYLEKDLLDREWAFTADYVRTEASYHLGPGDFSAPASRAAQERFRTFYEQTVRRFRPSSSGRSGWRRSARWSPPSPMESATRSPTSALPRRWPS